MEARLAEIRTSLPEKNRGKGRRWVLWIAGGLVVALAAMAGVVAVLARRAEPFMRARIVAGLEEHFHARVELGSLHVSLGNGLHGEWGVWAEGKGLRIWPPNQSVDAAGSEPLIRLDEFRFHARLRLKQDKTVHISVVRLKGLEIHLPPRSHFEHARRAGDEASKRPALVTPVVDRVECEGATLVLETSKPGKLPLRFDIAHLRLTDVTGDGPMGFDAELTNPRPVGTIHSTGRFGPWKVEDPGESAVTGDYRFEHADLATFKGIAGILTSTGHYDGTLRNLTVDGETETPDFRLSNFGTPLALHTRFHARVDGTNGDTWLDPVDAVLGHSHFTARGQVVRFVPPGSTQALGHDVSLAVNVDKARIEDFLKLTSHTGEPLLTGGVAVKALLHVPPGEPHVIDRMKLDGSFDLADARFTSEKIQGRIEELSLRGQGRPKEMRNTDPASIRSHMAGDFHMAQGTIALPRLEYAVPGAVIDLKGAYGIEGGSLDFAGTAKMDATVSQMVGGWKGMLLKPADRFFKKDGAGTAVAIHVNGTREDPKFGVDLKGVKSTSPETPGAAKPVAQP